MLTLREQHAHLLLFFFGAGKDPIAQCVNRAYRDFNRTMHGLRNHPSAGEAGRRYLFARLRELKTSPAVHDQNSFDAWHECTCIELIEAVKGARYEKMYVGQAQKWLNMALKYIFVFPSELVPDLLRVFPWCHIPIDNVILNCVEFKGAPKLGVAWSRVVEYQTYLSFQCWTRQMFPGQSLLAVEFNIWANAQAAS